jgi:hypothetical protein
MTVDFLATEAHFLDHLAPIWTALPTGQRGTFWVWANLVERARVRGVDSIAVADRGHIPPASSLTVVAAFGDMKRARRAERPTVLCEHGAGQSYIDTTSGSYIGAADRDGVVAVLVPGPTQAARHTTVHPTIPAYVVGVPKLDAWHEGSRPAPATPTVCISFHWNSPSTVETRWAFPHYRLSLAHVARTFPGALGHAHPRVMKRLRPVFQRAGLEPVEDFAEVLDRAAIYAVDNSSTLFEFASLDRPVVVLNSPRYRRHVEHGMRFWEFADIGVQVNRPEHLVAGIRTALDDQADVAARRRDVIAAVYMATDGKAARRAADALETVALTRVRR